MFISITSADVILSKDVYKVYCSTLRMGQYLCPDPEADFIDPETQQPKGCTKDHKAKGFDISYTNSNITILF